MCGLFIGCIGTHKFVKCCQCLVTVRDHVILHRSIFNDFWKLILKYLFCLFCCFMSQVNSYGHGGTVNSPYHTFFLGNFEQAVNQYFVHILSLVTDNNPS